MKFRWPPPLWVRYGIMCLVLTASVTPRPLTGTQLDDTGGRGQGSAVHSTPSLVPPASPQAARTNVRALDASSRAFLALGTQQSVTFRSLVELLDASDLLVYVETQLTAVGAPEASTLFVSHTGVNRVLKVRLTVGWSWVAVALLGHELQHAVEVARAPGVVDEESYLNLFESIGTPSRCHGIATACFETVAAEETAAHVRRELTQPLPRRREVVALQR
jgi:hypothetical protein